MGTIGQKEWGPSPILSPKHMYIHIHTAIHVRTWSCSGVNELLLAYSVWWVHFN